MFYSTYMYVYRLIGNTGHEIETIPGITASVLLVPTLFIQS